MKVDIEKEIRNVIEFHCGGSYPKRQKATELIMQIYQKQQLHIRIVRCFKIMKHQVIKSIWHKVFQIAKKMDKLYNFITR